MELQLERLRRQLAARHLELEVAPEALDRLCELGFDPVFGARPVKRLIQKEVVDRLALAMMEGRLEPGSAWRLGLDNGQFVLGGTVSPGAETTH